MFLAKKQNRARPWLVLRQACLVEKKVRHPELVEVTGVKFLLAPAGTSGMLNGSLN
jgi:hypothetical protein